MEVLKCLMCGGELELTENSSICKCKYCGSMQTLPRENTDITINSYNRAGYFFMNGEFDKAQALYEKILLDNPEDAKAYWSCILCKYGVTYVEDPATKERKITVNRTQNQPVEADELYKSAIEYATEEQRALFESEAQKIDEIQKGIIAISQNEEPFDIFISYKETDARGERTMDSVLATELYYGLTEAGYKVFLSRITLEDKLGQEYEPYIYAALNSSKVMIVLGTKPEYFNAPWVKNEWSRYLNIIKDDRHKMVIPAYRDMSPYDLPQEFALLQSQDMAKIGFLQDIIRGVRKIINRPIDDRSNKIDNNIASRAITPVGNLTTAEKIENIDKLIAETEILEVENGEIESKVFHKYIDTVKLDQKECRKSMIIAVIIAILSSFLIGFQIWANIIDQCRTIPWTTNVYIVVLSCIFIPIFSGFIACPRILLNKKIKKNDIIKNSEILTKQLRQDSFQPVLLAFVTIGVYNFVLIRRYYKALDKTKIDTINNKVFGDMLKSISDIKTTGNCEDIALRNTYVAEYRNNYNTIKDNHDKISTLKKHIEIEG